MFVEVTEEKLGDEELFAPPPPAPSNPKQVKDASTNKTFSVTFKSQPSRIQGRTYNVTLKVLFVL